MQRYLKRFLTVGIAVLALVAMLGLQAKVVCAATEILFIQDFIPAGYQQAAPNDQNPVVGVANDLNKTITRISSTTLNSMSSSQLAAYKIIIIAESQDDNYYERISNNQTKIASAVNDGTVLIAHLSDCNPGNLPTCTPGLAIDSYDLLPDGVGVSTSNDSYVSNLIAILQFNDCVLNGIADPANFAGWNWSSYGIFTNLAGLDNLVTVMESTPDAPAVGGPVYIKYSYGSGHVMATTQPIEYAYNNILPAPGPGTTLPEFLENEILCAQTQIPPEPDIISLLEDIQLRLIAIEAKLDTHDCPSCPTCPLCPECPLPDAVEPPLPWWRPNSSAEPPWSSILPLRNR